MAVNTEVRGVLSKWTNYWGGWKPRWFVLSKGVLAYYNSEDEEDKGCKASINVSAIDINVFSNDKTRFDITVQSEQHWCLKAKSSLERQSWLIAIATAKAGKEKGHLPIVTPTSSENHAKLKQKISELKLYTDLIVHQVVEIKTEANRTTIDSNKLTDASTMLSTTCDTFLGTLEQCMSLTENHLNLPLKPSRQNSSSVPPIHRQTSHRSHRSNSSGSVTPTGPSPLKNIHMLSDTSVVEDNNDDEFLDSLESTSGDINKNAISKKSKSIPLRPVEVTKPMSLFSNTDHGFKNIKLEADGGIPTEAFLTACESIIPFFDSIGPTAFAPVKIDMNGNVNKIQTKYITDKNRFAVLQNIIEQEMEIQVTKVRNSATVATLWLKRALCFIYNFLLNLKEGERDVQVALNLAYTVSLKQFHGWVVRGVFALAVKAAPSYDDFIKVVALDPECLLDEKYEACLMSELDDYLSAMEVIITIIDNFYQQHDLDDQSVV